MIFMSLQDGGFLSKQSPVTSGDCSPAPTNRGGVATCARNDMPTALLGELQSQAGEELLNYVECGHAFTTDFSDIDEPFTTNVSTCWNILSWNGVEVPRNVSYRSNVDRA